MKNYNEYTCSDIVSYGIDTFLILSAGYFDLLKDEIDLLSEIDYSDELQSITKQFCEIAMPSIGTSTPNHQVSEDYFDEASLLEAWRALFIQLEKIGCAEIILKWFNQFKQIETHFRSRLDFDWANAFLYRHKLKEIEGGPNLSQLTSQQLTILFLKGELRYFKWCCKLSVLVEYEKKDSWRVYVIKSLRRTVWMRLTMRDWRMLKIWIEIFKFLTPDEISELDRWGKIAFDKLYGEGNNGHFSLIQLAKDLEEHGYMT